MKQSFIIIKSVSVIDMTAEEAEKKGYRTNGSHGDGVEVTYENGYKSWCPLDVFKENGYPVFNEALANSCRLMLSEDYKERFIAEYMQIENRYNGLKKMIEKWDNGEISFTPTCPRETYNFQLRAMKDYMDILVIRAKMEGIAL